MDQETSRRDRRPRSGGYEHLVSAGGRDSAWGSVRMSADVLGGPFVVLVVVFCFFVVVVMCRSVFAS